MHPVPHRVRLWQSSKRFLRRCLPADLTQLLLIGGLVCFSVAPRLRWLPTYDILESFGIVGGPGNVLSDSSALSQWRRLLGLFVFPIPLLMFAGYWIAFWPGPRPARRLGIWVLMPALLVLCGACGFWLYLVNTAAPASILDTRSISPRGFVQSLSAVWSLQAPHFLTIGILLIAVFSTALARGKAALPLTISGGCSAGPNDESWQPTQRLTWTMLGPQGMVASFLSLAVFVVVGRLGARAYQYIGPYVAPTIEFVVLVGMAMLVVGYDGSRAAWRATKLRKPQFAIWGAVFPVLVTAALLTAVYLPQRAQWAGQSFGRFEPPAFFPGDLHFEPALILLLLAAFGEEFVFRGILQLYFVRRYGLLRGLVLLGIVWGAFHFPGDSYHGSSDLQVFLDLIHRVVLCLAIGLVLSWLTIRSGSILPATVAHGAWNILIYSGFVSGPFAGILRIALWGLLAYVLYTRLPLKEQTTVAGSEAAHPRNDGVVDGNAAI